MPPRRRPSGLDTAAVDHLRERLAAGARAPRVGVTGPQFDTGATGSVVRVGDPAVDGEDYITVRVKTGSVTDELTFAPAELTLAGRGSAGTSRPAARSTPPRRTTTAPAATPAGTTSAPPAKSAGEPTPKPTPAAARPTPKPAEKSAATTSRRSAPAGPARPRRAPVQKVTITVSSDGPQWSVSAQRGARAVVRKAPLTPGAVAALADLIGEPALTEAVAAINDTSREQAESRAATLRAELAELDAVLAAHRRPGRR